MALSLIIILFVLGYAAITLEHKLQINKSAMALLTGVLCWMVYILSGIASPQLVNHALMEKVSEISGILFFLMAAMTIVELIDVHEGFDIISSAIQTRNKKKLLWIVGFLSFFLSSILDNLTTTIVMVALIRKLIPDREDRLIYTGIIIIAANAGGAWTPIGDVTTTMLWIGGQITTINIIKSIFLPSLISFLIPLVLFSRVMKGSFEIISIDIAQKKNTTLLERNIVFYGGLGALLFVPIFKYFTELPPFMGIIFSLGVLWVLTEIMHRKKEEEHKDIYSVANALRRIDVPSVLFFLGILLSVAVLESTGLLDHLALWLKETIGNMSVIIILIGLLSAIIDNVPLVAAGMGMFDLSVYPPDNYIWEFMAYCAGTGGSVLIIGSAAGVAAMGMERIDFFRYLKKISFYALLGYLAGAAVYILIEHYLI